MDCPRILIIDSYDSFTNKWVESSLLHCNSPNAPFDSLAALTKKAIPLSKIYIIKNDELDFDQLVNHLPCFSAALVGPGPGTPLVPSDVGVGRDLWHLSEQALLPVFGVCLGLQSLGVEFGAILKRLDVVKHGQISKISHNEDELFDGVSQNSSVVRYHSLHIDISTSSQLVPLAFSRDEENGDVVMALKHCSKPFWAVQYHPESICTDSSGMQVLQNFWKLATAWRNMQNLVQRPWNSQSEAHFEKNEWPALRLSNSLRSVNTPLVMKSIAISLPDLDAIQLCDTLAVHESNTDFVLLDSAASPGRYTIIGDISPSTLKIQHFVGDKHVTLLRGKRLSACALGATDVWSWLASFMRTKETVGGNEEIPFWGGLVGYLSYELGLDTMDPAIRHDRHLPRRFPDVNLVFVERSIVLDSKSGIIHLQSLIPDDDEWFDRTAASLRCVAHDKGESQLCKKENCIISPDKPVVFCPEKDEYVSRVKESQEYLFAGESYELCLTARTRIRVPKSPVPSERSSWDLYKKLRVVNPAPYAAYMRLYPTTLVSSSPERFLSYSRPPSSRLQLRPIKGTVRKGRNMTRERAEGILNTPKEIGENLMIVDLIRHDLHGVIGTSVNVEKFCGIEEYETVWQLVSVIEGMVQPGVCEAMPDTTQVGWEVLKESLPPGSMTGAPKKRSVQILQDIEDDDRNIYSGVMGYWCVSGAGDWSVVIRTLYKVEDDYPGDARLKSDTTGHAADYDEWYAGAGGAITALSDPEAEWDEMLVKLQSVLRAFAEENKDCK